MNSAKNQNYDSYRPSNHGGRRRRWRSRSPPRRSYHPQPHSRSRRNDRHRSRSPSPRSYRPIRPGPLRPPRLTPETPTVGIGGAAEGDGHETSEKSKKRRSRTRAERTARSPQRRQRNLDARTAEFLDVVEDRRKQMNLPPRARPTADRGSKHDTYRPRQRLERSLSLPSCQYPNRRQQLDPLAFRTRYAPTELETPPTGIVLAGVEDDTMFDFDLVAQNLQSFEMK